MIITHTQDANGRRRIYLGGKGSLECWLEPLAHSRGWTFHLAEAVTGNALSPDDQRTWAIHTLKALADELNVAPTDLAAVPFETIAALHANDPYAGRRIASSKRKAIEQGFMSTAPHITRPRADFTTGPQTYARPRT